MRIIKLFDSFQDKYSLLEEIKSIFAYISDEFYIVDNVYQDYKDNSINIRINDKSINPYADDNYYIDIILDSSSPKTVTNSIDDLKDNILYNDLKSAIERLELIPEIKQVLFYYYFNTKGIIKILAYVNNYKHAQDIHEFDCYLSENGFNVGFSTIRFTFDDWGLTFVTGKPSLFNGIERLAKDIILFDESNNVKAKFLIDERDINTLICKNSSDDFKKQANWILDKFEEYKLLNKDSKKIYAHEFIIWLNNQKLKLPN